MPNATVRASARAMPKSAPKRDPLPTAVDLRQHAADLRSAVALMEAAKVVERELAEPKDPPATQPAAEETAAETEASPRDPADRAYVRWLRARAALNDPDVSYAEKDLAARQDDADEAARALLVTPISHADMVWQKWEVLEHFVSADAIDGPAFDNRTAIALGCVKADLLQFIGDGRSAQ
jgi:hypothetical protein